MNVRAPQALGSNVAEPPPARERTQMSRLRNLLLAAAIATLSFATAAHADGERSGHAAKAAPPSGATVSASNKQSVVLTRERGVRVWRPIVHAEGETHGGSDDRSAAVETTTAAPARVNYGTGGLAYPGNGLTASVGPFAEGSSKRDDGYVVRVRDRDREGRRDRYADDRRGHDGHAVKVHYGQGSYKPGFRGRRGDHPGFHGHARGPHRVVNIHLPSMAPRHSLDAGGHQGFGGGGHVGSAPAAGASFNGYSGLGATPPAFVGPKAFGAGHGGVRYGGRGFKRGMGRH